MKHEDIWRMEADAETADFVDDILLFFALLEGKEALEEFEEWRQIKKI